MFPSYVYIYQAAKDSSTSISDVCAVIAIITSVLLPLAINFYSKRNSVKETFWMREILIPQFSDVLFGFVKASPDKFSESESQGEFYMNYALDVINALKDSSRVLGIASSKLKEDLLSDIEYFEDEMMEVEDRTSYVLLLSNFSTKIVSSIQKAQFGV